MIILAAISLIISYGLMLNFASFLRALILLETLLLVASLLLLSFTGGPGVTNAGVNFTLIVLALAGTEAAVGLSLIMFLKVRLCFWAAN